MDTSEKTRRMSLALGIIALAGLFFSAWALMDIYQNKEPDLNMEWNIVKMGFLFVLMYLAMSWTTIFRIKKIGPIKMEPSKTVFLCPHNLISIIERGT